MTRQKKNARVLADFRETISELLRDEFTQRWHGWAASKGKITRNQAHGSPANILDLYAANDIPETEGQEILRMKFATSAAHVTGKPLASAEAATWLNEHTLATLGDTKQAVDKFFLGGVNHIVYHGTPFSPESAEWPGFLFYAAVHFGTTNPFWQDFAQLNAYVARCQSFLQAGKPASDVLLYYPIYDDWAKPGKNRLEHYGGGIESGLGQPSGKELLDLGVTYDLISDRQLQGVTSHNRQLQTGGNAYKAIVLPATKHIPIATFAKLSALARQGATIIAMDALPDDVPGWGQLAERRSALQKLSAALQFRTLPAANIASASLGKGKFLRGTDLHALLAQANIAPETIVAQGLQFVRRKNNHGQFYFLSNQSQQPFAGWVTLQTEAQAQSIAIFDPMTATKGSAALRKNAAGKPEIYVQLAAGASCIVQSFATKISDATFPYFRTNGTPQPLAGNWQVQFVRGGPTLPTAVTTTTLKSWTEFSGDGYKQFSGTANYTITFAKPTTTADAWLLDLGAVAASARVKLNGHELGVLINAPFQIRLSPDVLQAQNTLEIAVTNLMTNRVIELETRGVNWKKFYNVNMPARRRENAGADGLFTPKNWPPQASGLLSPVTLTPLQQFAP